jgi:hypothetical protein
MANNIQDVQHGHINNLDTLATLKKILVGKVKSVVQFNCILQMFKKGRIDLHSGGILYRSASPDKKG